MPNSEQINDYLAPGGLSSVAVVRDDASGNTALVGGDGTWEMVAVSGGKGGLMLMNYAQISSDAIAAITDSWLWFRLDQQYGSAYDKVLNYSEKLMTSELTLTANGTLNTGLYTDNAGWMTPKGTAYKSFIGAASATPSTDGITEFFELYPLTDVGGFLLVFDVYIPASAASIDYLCSASADSNQTNYGGFSVYVNAQQVTLSMRNFGGVATIDSQTQSGLSAGKHQIAFFVDGVNMVAQAYVDGAAATGANAAKDLSLDGTALPKMEHNRGVRLFATGTGVAGGVTTASVFGAKDNARLIRDMKFRRFERDVSADIGTLIADAYALFVKNDPDASPHISYTEGAI